MTYYTHKDADTILHRSFLYRKRKKEDLVSSAFKNTEFKPGIPCRALTAAIEAHANGMV